MTSTRTWALFAALPVIAVLLGSCADADEPREAAEAPAAEHEEDHFGYGDGIGPADWASLSDEYAACEAGVDREVELDSD
jgi:carbonic anhydrase